MQTPWLFAQLLGRRRPPVVPRGASSGRLGNCGCEKCEAKEVPAAGAAGNPSIGPTTRAHVKESLGCARHPDENNDICCGYIENGVHKELCFRQPPPPPGIASPTAIGLRLRNPNLPAARLTDRTVSPMMENGPGRPLPNVQLRSPMSNPGNCWWTETGWYCCTTQGSALPSCIAGGLTLQQRGYGPATGLGLTARRSTPMRTQSLYARNLARRVMRSAAVVSRTPMRNAAIAMPQYQRLRR